MPIKFRFVVRVSILYMLTYISVSVWMLIWLVGKKRIDQDKIDQVYHEVSATRSRTLFDLIFWLEDHFGSHKNFGSWGVSAAFAKYE